MDEYSITEHFVGDHKEHAELIQKYKDSYKTKDPRCIDNFNDLRNALLKHFNEEEDMYSIYEDRSETLVRLIKVIRDQHREMEKILEDAYDDEDADFGDEDFKHFFDILEKHTEIEEKELYPEFDRVLSAGEREEIIVNLQRKHVLN